VQYSICASANQALISIKSTFGEDDPGQKSQRYDHTPARGDSVIAIRAGEGSNWLLAPAAEDERVHALEKLWNAAGCTSESLERIDIEGSDPVLPSPFKIGEAAAATIGATTLAAAELWRLRCGRAQRVHVDTRTAAMAFRSERHLRIDGKPPPPIWDDTAGFHATGDGRWVQLHTNFPHHRERALQVLGCPADRQSVAEAVATWKGEELEEALVAANTCAAFVRTPEEWLAHPQQAAVAGLPLLEILRLGDSSPEPLPRADRPLSGVRVLDLTRIVAGPVAARALAAHGADVLQVSAPHLPNIERLVIDTGFGKRATSLDLRTPEDRETLKALIKEADVFLQAYRPGALDSLGLSPQALAAIRPGIVYVTLSAWGHQGPWRHRRGYDSLAQSATGIAWECGRDGRPGRLPAQAQDHASGYLAAFGTLVALHRRATQGGSYLVRVSLAQTGHWLKGLGRIEETGLGEPSNADIADLLEITRTPFGFVEHLRPVAASMSETPMRWTMPPVPLGTHGPGWW
jgi:crotonobetainyl-CoA:carnitine CoA-transferase CaiB-like acyl-CoA transferase